MNPRLKFLPVAPFLLLAGCGGSTHASSSQAPSTPAGTASAAHTTSTATSPATTTAAGATTTATKTTPTQTATKAKKPLPPPTHVRLPATFSITPEGSLNPPVIAVPKGLPVELTVASLDGQAHTVVLETEPRHTLKVPANGKASVLLPRLKKATYKVVVDGTVRGSLSIGVQVGP